jgi:hypothetical protein
MLGSIPVGAWAWFLVRDVVVIHHASPKNDTGSAQVSSEALRLRSDRVKEWDGGYKDGG